MSGWRDCYWCHGIGSDRVGICGVCGGNGLIWIEEEDDDESHEED